jgi:hypothetical protein
LPQRFIALAAVIVGPTLVFISAKRQMAMQIVIAYRSVISPMRQKWINDLRERVAEFVSEATWIYLLHFQSEESREKADVKPTTIRMTLLRNQIELMLNPAEGDHNALIKQIETFRACAIEDGRTNDYPKAVDDMNVAAKKILKDGWERVKRKQAAPTDNFLLRR